MPILPAKNKWARQPRYFCEPKNSWLDLGLNFIQFGESNFIWFNGKILFPSIAEKVYGADYIGSRDVSLPNSITQELITTWPITTFALIKSEQGPSSSRYPAIITQSDYDNTNSQGIEIGLYGNTGVSTTTPYAIVRGGDYIQNQSTISLSNSVTSSMVTAIAHRANNSGHRLDGFELGYAVGNIISKPTANTVKSTAFGVTSSGDKCTIILHLRFAQYLPNDILFELKRNPWQIFRSKKRISYFDLSSAADLSAAAQATASATGAINQAVAMSGASVVIASATGAVNQSVGLSGAAASVSVADGAVNVTTTLSGDGFVESFASGALASALALEASAQAAATAAGDLSTDADLAGTAVAQAAATGSIGLSVSLSADSLIQAMASANLDSGAANDLSGNAAAIATATGGIMQDVPVLGSATITVTGAGGLSSTLQLEGAAAVSALAGGDLQVSALGLSANAIIQALAGGSIEMTMSLSAAALAQALAVGTLTVGDLWSGAFIEKYTALAPARNYTATAPERNYTATA